MLGRQGSRVVLLLLLGVAVRVMLGEEGVLGVLMERPCVRTPAVLGWMRLFLEYGVVCWRKGSIGRIYPKFCFRGDCYSTQVWYRFGIRWAYVRVHARTRLGRWTLFFPRRRIYCWSKHQTHSVRNIFQFSKTSSQLHLLNRDLGSVHSAHLQSALAVSKIDSTSLPLIITHSKRSRY